MCDDFTQSGEDVALAGRGISRRDFAAFGAAAVLAGCSFPVNGKEPSRELTERMVQVTTTEGMIDAFFVHPAKGAFPGIVLWPDIAGLREMFKVMARRMADSGYAVLVVNQSIAAPPRRCSTASPRGVRRRARPGSSR